MFALVDSHCHLDDAAFDTDRDAVMARARAAGVDHIIVPATTTAGWAELATLCANHAHVHGAYGLHPGFLADHHPEHLADLRAQLAKGGAAAVGECGLDFYRGRGDADSQHRYFRGQLELANEFDLPVIVHALRAVEEVILDLRAVGNMRGVVHSFSGSLEQAKRLWDMGFYLGIGGPVTYERATRLRSIVATMPLQHLLLETDSPDQPDAAHRGQRNEPARLPGVLACIAELRKSDIETIARATSDNARMLFNLG